MTPTGLEIVQETGGKVDLVLPADNAGDNTPDEIRLIQAFRRLSSEEQQRVLERLEQVMLDD